MHWDSPGSNVHNIHLISMIHICGAEKFIRQDAYLKDHKA